MAEARVERRLAAILAADVAGYSRLMGVDEEGTLAALKAYARTHRSEDRRTSRPHRQDHGRRRCWSNLRVPSTLSVVPWKSSAPWPSAMPPFPKIRRIEFRIGINVGDIIIDEGDIYGDGVNIAARLEALARPGAICISDNAYQQIKGKIALDVSDMGEQQLKNIAEPVRVYSVRLAGARGRARRYALPDKPSIAVLPFQNMSGDPEQEYFADGMVEDIITALSRIRWLFVIARNSSFTYKGRAVDVKQVGRELGVRYVLEGSVRKAAQPGAHHRAADRCRDRRASVGRPLRRRARRHLRAAGPGHRERRRRDRAAARAGRDRARQAQADREPRRLRLLSARNGQRPSGDQGGQRRGACVVLQGDRARPGFRVGLRHGRVVLFWRKVNGWMTDRTKEIAEGARLARRAVEMGKDDAVASHGAAMRSPGLSVTSTVPRLASTGRWCSIRTWRRPGISAAG